MSQISRMAVYVYLILSGVVVTFQVALGLGAPWGAYAMGGSFPGQLPASARIGVLAQAALIALMACVVASRAGVALPGLRGASGWLVWVVVALLSLSLVGNLLSPSGGERMLWVPVLILMLVSAALVAFGHDSSGQAGFARPRV